jgi:hypothetical protein
MTTDVRSRAETRLTEAAAALHLADPRGPFRERLKQLRETDPEAFQRAVAHYEQDVLPGLAEGDVLAVWLEYGRFLGQLSGNGRLTAIDATGRSTVYRPPLAPGTLVLFLPEDTAVDALVAATPQQPSPAQQATIDLLVSRRLALD